MSVRVENIAYEGWSDCVRISNDAIELIVTLSVGPRVIKCNAIGQPNMMCQVPDTLGRTGDPEWNIYGGHRLWHSPEARPRSYAPDNAPVPYTRLENGIETLQDVEPWTGMRKRMRITMDASRPNVSIHHTLTNEGAWPVTLSAWALTVLDVGGLEVIPQTRVDTDLLANRSMSLWPYTRMDDPRWTWGDRYILLRQDPDAKTPTKIGISNDLGWAAYFNHDQLFLKTFQPTPGAAYPDNGCSFETYTCDYMLEMETLSPLTTIATGESIEHDERWTIAGHVARPEENEEAIARALAGYVG